MAEKGEIEVGGDYVERFPRPKTSAKNHRTREWGKTEQWDKAKLRWMFIGMLVGFWFLSGVVVYYHVCGWSLIDCVYMLTQVITTVGYGDLTPRLWDATSESMKFFCSVHILICNTLVAGIVSQVADQVLNSISKKAKEDVEESNEAVKNSGGAVRESKRKKKDDEKAKQIKNLILSFTVFFFFVIVGTIFFSATELCVCDGIDGCNEDNCYDVGAWKSYMDTYYLSCITLTTVGFGDISASSQVGRVFATLWMFVGVGAMVNFVTAFSEFIMNGDKAERFEVFSEDLFYDMDTSGDGVVDRGEFLIFMLQRYEMVDQSTINKILKHFEYMDVDGTGSISLDELRRLHALGMTGEPVAE